MAFDGNDANSFFFPRDQSNPMDAVLFLAFPFPWDPQLHQALSVPTNLVWLFRFRDAGCDLTENGRSAFLW
jgi:hypothetical protein